MIYLYNGILFSHEKNKVLIHAAAWMSLENNMLSKERQTQKATYCVIHLCEMSRIGKLIGKLVVARGWEEWGIGMTDEYRVSFRIFYENILVLHGGDGYTTL